MQILKFLKNKISKSGHLGIHFAAFDKLYPTVWSNSSYARIDFLNSRHLQTVAVRTKMYMTFFVALDETFPTVPDKSS